MKTSYSILLLLVIVSAFFIMSCKKESDPVSPQPAANEQCKWLGASGGCSSDHPYSCDKSSQCYTTLARCESSGVCK